MHGYPQFSFWILISLVEICFCRIFIKPRKNTFKLVGTVLKAAIVLLAVGLQKPSQRSKAKEHQEYLAKRLALWKEGEIDVLVRERRMFQKRLTNSRRAIHPIKQMFLQTLS